MTICLDQLTDAVALRSLVSKICPACGRRKREGQSLCPQDYFRLPRPLRVNLWQKITDGYLEALLEAMKTLGTGRLHVPAIKG